MQIGASTGLKLCQIIPATPSTWVHLHLYSQERWDNYYQTPDVERAKYEPFHKSHHGYNSAAMWEELGCPYEQALELFKGDEVDKRKALGMVQELGGTAVYEKLKMEMRASGIRSIPRGMRESTRANVARLTEREVDVLKLLKEGMQNKEIADRLFISAKTVDHHITSILFKLDVNTRVKAVHEAINLDIIK